MLVPNPRGGRAQWPARVMPVLPLFTVTVFAGFGQVLAGVGAYTPADWDTRLRVLVAVGIAIGLEMIAVYVQWHAHDALLLKATATAARLRRVSYLIAGAVAAFQYSHFADHWAPTASAVVFAAFSGSSPWLWGLHTRRAQHLQLLREGHADTGGATFAAERYRAFPIRTWKARRFSIDYSITDPREAWEGCRTEAAKKKTASADTPSEPPPFVWTVDETAALDLGAIRETANRFRAEKVTAPAPAETTTTDAAPASKPALRIAKPARTTSPTVRASVGPDAEGKARELAAAGVGRTRIMQATGLKDHVAKEIVREAKAAKEAAQA